MSDSFSERASSRKFLLALLCLIAGTALQMLDQLTDSWVTLAAMINGLYAAGNVAQKTLVRRPTDVADTDSAPK